MTDIAQRLSDIHRRHGSGAVGWYFGNPGAFSYSHLMAVICFVNGLGLGAHLFTASSQDTHSRFAWRANCFTASRRRCRFLTSIAPICWS